jgi:hypothetical protein
LAGKSALSIYVGVVRWARERAVDKAAFDLVSFAAFIGWGWILTVEGGIFSFFFAVGVHFWLLCMEARMGEPIRWRLLARTIFERTGLLGSGGVWACGKEEGGGDFFPFFFFLWVRTLLVAKCRLTLLDTKADSH